MAISGRVSGTLLYFAVPRVIGAARLDTPHGGLNRGGDSRAVAEMSDPARRRRLRLWADESLPYLMVYTHNQVGPAGTPAPGGGHRTGDMPAERAARRGPGSSP